VINVGGHPAYTSAVAELKQSGEISRRLVAETAPCLHHIIEQEHRITKKRMVASCVDSSIQSLVLLRSSA
jgi:IS6 family transposase